MRVNDERAKEEQARLENWKPEGDRTELTEWRTTQLALDLLSDREKYKRFVGEVRAAANGRWWTRIPDALDALDEEE
jgi:hypothetical protein